MQRLFHYTTGILLGRIKVDGIIRPTAAGVPAGERPAVWLSFAEHWEPTATKYMRDSAGNPVFITFEKMVEFAGAGRIEVATATAPIVWQEFRSKSGMKSGDFRRLERAGVSNGSNPFNWRATFDPIPREKWLAVEIFDSKSWEWKPDAPAA